MRLLPWRMVRKNRSMWQMVDVRRFGLPRIFWRSATKGQGATCGLMSRQCRRGNGVQIQSVRRSLHIEQPPACRGRNEGHHGPHQALRPAGGLICQASTNSTP